MSTTTAPLAWARLWGSMANTAFAVPAAAQTVSKQRRSGSKRTGNVWVCPKGGTPPMAKPVAARTSSGEARRTRSAPRCYATFALSTRFGPEVSTRTGLPSAINTIDFAIWPRLAPTA